jgi:hypothetical protein
MADITALIFQDLPEIVKKTMLVGVFDNPTVHSNIATKG